MSEERSNDEQRQAERVLIVPWTWRQLAIGTLVISVIAYLIWRGTPALGHILTRLKAVCATLVLALVLAYVAGPVVHWFCRYKPFSGTRAGRVCATLLVFCLGSVVLTGAALLTANPLVTEFQELNVSASKWMENAPAHIEGLLEKYNQSVPPEIVEIINSRLSTMAESVVGFVTNFAVGMGHRVWWLVEAFLVPVLAFYFIADSRSLVRGALSIVPAKRRERVEAGLSEMNESVHSYIRGQLILCLIAAVITALVLKLLSVPAFLTLGLLAGISRAIPVIGSIVSGIAITAIAWLQVDLRAAVIAGIAFSVMNFLESKIVMPKVLGHHAELHPIIVIVALLAGGEFFGLIGMFVAVPIVAVVRVAIVHWVAATKKDEVEPA